MAEQKYDGVVEAVHYQPDGRVDWVRAYLRRGAAWSDRVIIQRDELIKQIKAGKKFMTGKRVEFMAGTFEVSQSISVAGSGAQETLSTSSAQSNGDYLVGVPVL